MVLAVGAMLYVAGFVAVAAQWIGFGNTARIAIEPAELGDSGQFLLHLPPTEGDIRITSDPAGAPYALDPSVRIPPTETVDNDAITILQPFCQIGCTVGLTYEGSDEVELIIEYLAHDSEYVDDITVEYRQS